MLLYLKTHLTLVSYKRKKKLLKNRKQAAAAAAAEQESDRDNERKKKSSYHKMYYRSYLVFGVLVHCAHVYATYREYRLKCEENVV